MSRLDFLSLNLKVVKDHLLPEKRAQLKVSGNDFGKHLDPSSWLLSASSQVAVSRNKLGKSLLKPQRHEFLLDDPHMNNSRFFVDYHRLQDPALKRYYNSIPTRKRLEELHMVTEENDAICSTKELADYLRYLDRLHCLSIIESIKHKSEQRLSNHLQKIDEDKKQESKYTGIFRHKKHEKGIPKKRTDRKIKVTTKRIDLAIERVAKINEERSLITKFKNRLRDEKCNLNKKMIAQKDAKRAKAAKFAIKNKLELAEKRKKALQRERQLAKNTEAIEHFKIHWRIREQALEKNIEVYKEYEEMKQKNIKSHKERTEKLCELDTNKKITIRREMAIKQSNEKIIEIISKKMRVMSQKYSKLSELSHSEEISRRIGLLTQQFIVESLNKIEHIFRNLKITVSYATLVYKTLSLMQQTVFILPDIGPSKCVLVRKLTADFIANAKTRTKNRSLKRIKSDSNRSSKSDTNARSSTYKSIHFRRSGVSVIDVVQAVEKSINYSKEGRRRKVSVSKSDHECNYNKMVYKMLKYFFESITNFEYKYADWLKSRDFMHLYEYQKFYIHGSIKRLMGLVKEKHSHYWSEKSDVTPWRDLNLKLEELSLEAADLVMSYPWESNQLCDCVRKISKFICIEISLDINKDSDYESFDDESSSDSDWDE